MQMDFGLLSLAYCPLLLSPSFLFSIVSIAVPSQSCQLPNCDLFTSLALLSSFGRETSLVKITGPRSIFTSLFTPKIYFQLLLSLVPFISCVDPLKMTGPEELTTPLYSLGAKLFVAVCRSR